MSTSADFIEYVCGQIANIGAVTHRKMFGEYMVYVNAKPLLLVCDNTVYVKMLDCVKDELAEAEVGDPYPGARPHYILNVDDRDLCEQVIRLLESVTPVPKPKKAKTES